MGGADKLFARLAGRPLLAHSLVAFQQCPAVERIVLVLSERNRREGAALVEGGAFPKVETLCLGGERRQDSVRAGLAALSGVRPDDWVVVHDGARPLVTPALIEQGLAAARETGAAVCALPAQDTVKEADEQGLVRKTLDRKRLWLVQTPQVFRYDVLREAHERARGDSTDDASLVEALGHRVRLYMGSQRNLKVTTPADLALAEALLRAQTS
jgi:2-C-methyl-D-erythritol 4-phosphate cytidylyltransferase